MDKREPLFTTVKERVIETVEIESYRQGADKRLNKYLKLGWVLIADWIVDYGERDIGLRRSTSYWGGLTIPAVLSILLVEIE